VFVVTRRPHSHTAITGQRCPVFAGMTRRLYWSFPDPAIFSGTHAERLDRVIEVRDAIEARLQAWIQKLPTTTRGRR
jgi:arsenate reductase